MPGLADLQDALAVARLERDRALGLAAEPVPHAQARAQLLAAAGLDAEGADAPDAEGARPWGTHHYRLHRGVWRVLYRVDEQARTIHIEHVGRT